MCASWSSHSASRFWISDFSREQVRGCESFGPPLCTDSPRALSCRLIKINDCFNIDDTQTQAVTRIFTRIWMSHLNNAMCTVILFAWKEFHFISISIRLRTLMSKSVQYDALVAFLCWALCARLCRVCTAESTVKIFQHKEICSGRRRYSCEQQTKTPAPHTAHNKSDRWREKRTKQGQLIWQSNRRKRIYDITLLDYRKLDTSQFHFSAAKLLSTMSFETWKNIYRLLCSFFTI